MQSSIIIHILSTLLSAFQIFHINFTIRLIRTFFFFDVQNFNSNAELVFFLQRKTHFNWVKFFIIY